jgi:uncharacterized protein YbbC (DUF1343 family)/CubicO group peptidase (beta-lactamase class C family)
MRRYLLPASIALAGVLSGTAGPASGSARIVAVSGRSSSLQVQTVERQFWPVQTLAQSAGPVPATSRPVVDLGRLSRIDELVAAAIREQKLPGAVVLIGDRGGVVFRKAYGARAVLPAREAMTLDTIFDLASLTKVIATATSVMVLVEEGRLRLTDRVVTYLPGFERYDKGDVTIADLLTHVSGLRPDLDLTETWTGYDAAIARALDEVPLSPAGQQFVYSDINFFLLGDIVRRVSGLPLEEFARRRIFQPLGMRDTVFNPPASLTPRIAPTQPCRPEAWPCTDPTAPMLRGLVHDPTARRMGGVAGHAGLFSTAADLAIYCRMMLGRGSMNGVRVLSPLTVARMTTPSAGSNERNVRGLGWDIDSTFSTNRGELYPIGSFGHTGFTGTSIWIDPLSETFVVFLSSRLHPDGKGDVTPLRARVATVAASAVQSLRSSARPGRVTGPANPAGIPLRMPPPPPVATGIDVLQEEGFARLRGRRVGLLTNQTGRSRTQVSTIDLLHRAGGVTLVALLSPEHGIRGELDEAVDSSRDDRTGLPIHSLYGSTTRPTDAMLEGIDTIVVDLQDIGARFYTYMTTMAYVMEEAAKKGIRVVVLDRPNPIGGIAIEGPLLDADRLGFTGYLPMPIRHGLTIGELARLFNAERKIGADLTVVEMKAWRRQSWFDETGLTWVNPSPNMRNLIQAMLYPGIGAIEGTNISVGRGTGTPFEQLGAPWIDGARVAAELNARHIAGVRFYPVSFTPTSSKFAGETCGGVFFIVSDREALRPVRVGIEIASVLHRLYPEEFQIDLSARLLGSRDAIARIKAGEDPARIADVWAAGELSWRDLRAPYLLYR